MLFNLLFGALLCVITFLFFKELNWRNNEVYSNIFMEFLLITAGIFIMIKGDSLTYYLTIILTIVMFNFYVSIALAISSGRKLLPEAAISIAFLTMIYYFTRSLITSASIFGLIFPIILIMGFWRLRHNLMKYLEFIILIFVSSLIVFYIIENSLIQQLGVILFICSSILALVSFLILFFKRELLPKHPDDNPTREVNRKIVHLIFATSIGLPFFGIIIPIELLKNMLTGILYLFTNKNYIIGGLRIIVILVGGSLLLIVMFFEKLRLSKNFILYPENLLREVEKHNFAAYVYFLVSMFVIAVLYNEYIFVVSIIVALIADAMSAIVGLKFGRRKITNDRTVEGTLAGFLAAFILLELFTRDFLASIMIALMIAVLDVLHQYLKVDDNLLFPNVIALLLFLLW